MLPIVLDPSKLRAGLAGQGPAVERRVQTLIDAGMSVQRVEKDIDVASLDVLFVAGLDRGHSEAFANAAHALGILVNVEDVPELCDFHVPAIVRRGDLTLTVSTNGRAPGLARAVRAMLEKIFGPEWRGRTNEVARLRDTWRGEGTAPAEVSARIAAHASEQGWLS